MERATATVLETTEGRAFVVDLLACDGKCYFNRKPWRGGCEAEVQRAKVVARSGKPSGYVWRLWNDPRGPGDGNRLPTAYLNRTTHPLAWVQRALTPAYRRAA